MDTQTKLALMKRIDDFVEAERPNQPGIPDTRIMVPELERIAAELNMDLTDLFIMYMDHIAINSRRVAQEAEQEIDFSNVTKFY